MDLLRVWLALVLSTALVAGGSGCGDDLVVLPAPVRHDVTAAELQTMIDDGSPIILVDVRSAGEYATGHIEGSINVPLGTVATWAATQRASARIVCICLAGSRSRSAADQLVALGFSKVYNLLGGVSNWPGDLVT